MPLESIALSFVPQLGVRGAAHLVDCFGSAQAVYAASHQELVERAELRADVARSITLKRGFVEAERELSYCKAHGISAIGCDMTSYPPLLREVEDFPMAIYVRGEVDVLMRPAVAFVGTRKMSTYGQRMCDKLVSELHEVVPEAVVVSGLAYGVDGACHRAALACGAATVGVVANTLPGVTPVQHERLAQDMIAHGGAVVTELNSQSKQNGRYFIPRNRIIAALCAGVVVVESSESGGSLSTAAFADGYNRTVMAVAGRAVDANSMGCNMLIRNRKAQMVLSGRDVAEELHWEFGLEEIPTPRRELLPLGDDEAQFLSLFGQDPISLDALQVRSGMSAGELSLMLMNLELSGAVRQLPGKLYEKLL
ncbi:MAG: DNA-protecting protein DprA [Alistipes sp.]|nr:DNA-protecting protein DprA [Alistipes sp.]